MAMKNTYRFARICLFLLLAIVLLLAGRWTVVRIQRHKAYLEAKNSMVLRIDQSKLIVEAGDSVSPYDAVTASGGQPRQEAIRLFIPCAAVTVMGAKY